MTTDAAEQAREICLRLLAAGPRTAGELATRLRAKGVPDEVATEVLTRFADVGIVDDALFARMWVDSRHRSRGLSGRALSQELRRKGVDDAVVREAVGELDPEEEVATARSLVRRKLGATRGLTTEARVRRLAGLLARKGYPAGLAFRVVKEELEAEGADVPVLDTDGLSSLG
ncbi:MAG TPA: regulatory protein RecX [Mycobacteriales bacterium]|nr:regulatory protein RecX [Mycobacteriales bacterium]